MPDPNDLRIFRRHAEWALVAATAQELGVLDTLAAGPASSEALARELSLHPRGLSILLGALEALEVVRQDADGWRLTGTARGRLVDPTALDYEAPSLRQWWYNIRRWATELPEAVRTGEPVGGVEASLGAKRDEAALERFMAAMDRKDATHVERVVEACLSRVPGARRALDVGGGPGTFARAFAERGVRVTLLDWPDVLAFVAPRYGLAAHPDIDLFPADFLEELPEGPFDIVLLANITHIYPADTNASLIARLADRLRGGGVLGVLDFVRGRSEFATLFGITMLLNTERGNTYGEVEYTSWLEAAGLSSVRFTGIDEDVHLISAARARPASADPGRVSTS